MNEVEVYEEWEDMMNDIEMLYTDKENTLTAVTQMEPNTMYVARIDKSWFRVQLESVLESNQVNCKVKKLTVMKQEIFDLFLTG